jgi:hypothetical protein
MVLAVVGAASAGIPDPNLSSVEMYNGGYGLASCYAGEGPAYQYITVTAKRSDATPIEGIPASSFFWTVTGCDVTITAVDPATNSDGEIRFSVVADEVCCCEAATLDEIEIQVQIYTVAVNDTDTLYANSFSEDCNNANDPIDFSLFAGDFPPNAYDPCSDFDFSTAINPVDFSLFSGHFDGPTHP